MIRTRYFFFVCSGFDFQGKRTDCILFLFLCFIYICMCVCDVTRVRVLLREKERGMAAAFSPVLNCPALFFFFSFFVVFCCIYACFHVTCQPNQRKQPV